MANETLQVTYQSGQPPAYPPVYPLDGLDSFEPCRALPLCLSSVLVSEAALDLLLDPTIHPIESRDRRPRGVGGNDNPHKSRSGEEGKA